MAGKAAIGLTQSCIKRTFSSARAAPTHVDLFAAAHIDFQQKVTRKIMKAAVAVAFQDPHKHKDQRPHGGISYHNVHEADPLADLQTLFRIRVPPGGDARFTDLLKEIRGLKLDTTRCTGGPDSDARLAFCRVGLDKPVTNYQAFDRGDAVVILLYVRWWYGSDWKERYRTLLKDVASENTKG